MNKIMPACVTLAMLLLAACANPPSISSNPVQDVVTSIGSLPGGSTLQTQMGNDITDAQFNFNQAVTVGALSANDPAPGCLNSIVTLTGLGGTGPVTASFVPKMDGPVSVASVAYIRLQQASGLAGGGNISAMIPVTCLALIGKMNIDGLQQINKAAITAIPIPGVSTILQGLPVPLGERRSPPRKPSPGSQLSAPLPKVADNASLGGR